MNDFLELLNKIQVCTGQDDPITKIDELSKYIGELSKKEKLNEEQRDIINGTLVYITQSSGGWVRAKTYQTVDKGLLNAIFNQLNTITEVQKDFQDWYNNNIKNFNNEGSRQKEVQDHFKSATDKLKHIFNKKQEMKRQEEERLEEEFKKNTTTSTPEDLIEKIQSVAVLRSKDSKIKGGLDLLVAYMKNYHGKALNKTQLEILKNDLNNKLGEKNVTINENIKSFILKQEREYFNYIEELKGEIKQIYSEPNNYTIVDIMDLVENGCHISAFNAAVTKFQNETKSIKDREEKIQSFNETGYLILAGLYIKKKLNDLNLGIPLKIPPLYSV